MTETIAPWDVGRPIPQPSTTIPSAAPAQLSDAGPRAMAITGQELKETAAEVDRFGLHIETLQAQDALNQLRSKKDDLTYGQQGFMQVKGGDVINPNRPGGPLLDDYSTRLRAASDDLAKSLGPRGRMMYNERAAAEMTALKSDISRHSLQQIEHFETGVFKDSLGRAETDAARYAADPAKLDTAIKQAEGAARNYAISKGLPPESLAVSARSGVIRTAITALIPNNPLSADALFQANRDSLDGPTAVELERTIKDAVQQRRTQDIVGLVTATGGVSSNYNARTQAAEGGGTYTENKIGALGKYQMIPGTYTDLAQQTEWGKGKSQAEVRQMLLDPKTAEGRQDELKRLYDDRSLKALTQAGVPVNDLTLYTTHFLGHGAGPELLKLPDDTPFQAGLIKAHGGDAAFVQKVNEANPFLTKVRTVGDFKALMAQKIGAPLTLANAGTPQRPNLDAMLASGLAMAGTDPDQRDRVTQAIKTDYSTKLAIYNSQIGAVEKRAFGHIDSGGTVENLPSDIKGALDADGLAKVQTYEEKRLVKRQRDNAEAAGKGLADLEKLGQLTVEDVDKAKNLLPEKEYRAWQRRAVGIDRTDDPRSYEMLQRGLGTRDMRDDIFSEFNAGNLSRESADRLLDKNAAFTKENAAPTPYKVNHDRITRSLDPGLMGSGISREIYGRAVKEFDQYVAGNAQREGETPEQYRKRLDAFSEDTVKRHQMLNTQEMAISKPVPAHTTLNRADMTGDKSMATKKIAGANAELSKKFADGLITEDQYNRDAITLSDWLNFVQTRPDPQPAKK